MRLFTTFFCLFIAAAAYCQQSLSWSSIETVSETGGYRPRIALNNTGNAVISWGDQATGQIYAAVANGTGFSPAVQVTPAGVQAYVESWTSHEMASFGDTVYIVFKRKPEATGGLYIVKSIDGGLTFSDTIRIDPSNGNIPWLPTVTTDDAGNPVVAYMDNDPGWLNPRFVLTSSNDGGLTFSAPVNATEGNSPGEVCDCCPATVNASGNDRYIIYRNNENNIRNIWVAKSIDGGNSFNMAAALDTTDTFSNACQSTGPDGFIYNDSLITVWRATVNNRRRIYVSAMDASNMAIGTHKPLNDEVPTYLNQNYPRISGNDEVLGVVWDENLSGKANILFAWSATGTSGLVTRDTVNIDTLSNQLNADIQFRDNAFHITWQNFTEGKVFYKKASINPLNTGDQKDITGIKLYPNPAQSGLNIALPFNAGVYTLYDVLGKTVLSNNISDRNLFIDLKPYSLKGIYFLKVNNKDLSYVEKIVIAE